MIFVIILCREKERERKQRGRPRERVDIGSEGEICSWGVKPHLQERETFIVLLFLFRFLCQRERGNEGFGSRLGLVGREGPLPRGPLFFYPVGS